MEFVPSGTVFESPETGETTEIIETPEQTGDRYRVHVTFAPGSDSERHIHPGLIEKFTVKSGTVSVRLGRSTSLLGVGDQREVPLLTTHAISNPGDEPAEVDVDIVFASPGPRPEADLVRFGAAYEALASGGRRVGILPMAVLMDEYRDAFALPMPVGLQRVAIRPLAALGRARGHGVAEH